MSVDFNVKGMGKSFSDLSLNLANGNARSVLDWLGVDAGEYLCGEIKASELAAKCRRRLWPEKRNEDPGVPMTEEIGTRGCHVVSMGRRDGYLPEKVKLLLELAEEAGPDGVITWG